MEKKFYGLILARGGSKGIPQKNIKRLNGKPLIAYSIEEAKKSQYIERILLSTDDLGIAEVGEQYGAEIPFLRPSELAADDTGSVEVILHILHWLKNHEEVLPEYFVLLQPTSPLRTVEDLDGAIQHFLASKADSLVSLCEVDQHPFWMKKIVENRVVPFMQTEGCVARRQELSSVYMLNGSIYIARTDLFMIEHTFYVGETVPYIMPKERSVDIDTMMDWMLADALLRERE